MGIRYSALPGHTMELSEALNEVLSRKWTELRGIMVYSLGVNSVTASKEDEDMIRQLQKSAVMRDPNMAAAALAGAQADAMRIAAGNRNGAMAGFMGMGMAQQAGGADLQSLYAMGQRQTTDTGRYQAGEASRPYAPGQYQSSEAPRPYASGQYQPSGVSEPYASGQYQPPQPSQALDSETGWSCGVCKTTGNTGKFCVECGAPKPVSKAGWTCACGTQNRGKFCSECGSPRPGE